jgi:PEP-CTERM motif
MRFTRATTAIAVLAGLAVTPTAPAAADPIVWAGPFITFTKPDFADPTLPVNQDRLTDHVWLTRLNARPLFNIFVEEGPDDFTSPLDTEWAFGPTQPGNPGPITASNFANLVFDPFAPALGRLVGNNILRFGPGVLHLISEDIYLDIRFTSWTSGEVGGGGFSYIRSTAGPAPVPEPATMLLVTSGLGGVLYRRMRRRRKPAAHGI